MIVKNNLKPHQQRVLDEKIDLDEKLIKLRAFFDTEIFVGLDEKEKSRLIRQLTHMDGYSAALADRIAAFSNS
ncbi:hypothetical protein [Aeromonas sp. JL9]|uniref:crAss001_48 related protein n=1 Tax=Aeromonas sp. JL9 TaxID=2950549 RepID=UPI00210BC118|nr:hypothetical protein [Aeromonas sp. JL9]MCQ4108074.1 hypothetical protein [Aeromonas sp. JL9]